VIGIVQVGEQSIADRYTYLPLIGVFVMVCYAAPPRKSAGVVAAIALLACAALTAYQVRFWRDDLALFRRALETTDRNYLAHGYVGKALAAAKRPAEAVAHYDRALAIKPGYFEVHYNRANLLLADGRLDDAIAGYRRAVEINPEFPEAWQNLAAAYARKGDLERARACLNRAAESRAKRESGE
jgi:tetratricopeptide (TPR) repeat protein